MNGLKLNVLSVFLFSLLAACAPKSSEDWELERERYLSLVKEISIYLTGDTDKKIVSGAESVTIASFVAKKLQLRAFKEEIENLSLSEEEAEKTGCPLIEIYGGLISVIQNIDSTLDRCGDTSCEQATGFVEVTQILEQKLAASLRVCLISGDTEVAGQFQGGQAPIED